MAGFYRLLRYLLYGLIYISVQEWVSSSFGREQQVGGHMLVLLLLIPFAMVEIYLKNRIKLTRHVSPSFLESGLEIVAERVPRWSEHPAEAFKIKPVYNIIFTGVPDERSRYRKQFFRIFRVKDNTGQLHDCYTEDRKLWDGRFNCEMHWCKPVGSI